MHVLAYIDVTRLVSHVEISRLNAFAKVNATQEGNGMKKKNGKLNQAKRINIFLGGIEQVLTITHGCHSTHIPF